MQDIDKLKEWAEQGMYSRVNEAVMYDTLELCETNLDLIKAIESSISKQYIIFGNQKISVNKKPGNTNIIISQKRTYQAVQEYKGKKVAVLDFANYYSVGGAPFSAGAQEESMCRCSTLYPCINTEKNKKDYYNKHINERIRNIIDNYGGDDVIYVPNVIVFKTDESIPEILDKSEWYKTDVIVAAAPELFHGPGYSKILYKSIMEKRIKRILDIAYQEKVEVVILGAFGCGAFENPPEIVAEIFKNELANYDFKTVEFAIYGKKINQNKNFEIFSRAFN